MQSIKHAGCKRMKRNVIQIMLCFDQLCFASEHVVET